MTRHLLLIGIHFKWERGQGDKNFWFDLLPLFCREYKRITIFSLYGSKEKNKFIKVNECEIYIKFMAPYFLPNPDCSKNKKKPGGWGEFPYLLAIIEKFLFLFKLIPSLFYLKRNYPFDNLHIMDNLGFINFLITCLVSSPVTISCISYQGRKPFFLYNLYLRISYFHPRLRIIAYNELLADRLKRLCIRNDRIKFIPWGVSVRDIQDLPSVEDKLYIRKKLGLPVTGVVILWSGYIQQLGRDSFLYAYSIIKNIVAGRKDVICFFAFKPESFERNFKVLNKPDEGLIVQPTSKNEFMLLSECCDFFFSPVVNKYCIITPPLTWIELLNNGIPIITTKTVGIEKVIEVGKTGFLIKDGTDLMSIISNPEMRTERIKLLCSSLVHNKFNITHIADSYLEYFREQ